MRLASLVLSIVLIGTAHAGQVVQISACGQAVPRGALGQLTGDLDCTTFVGGIANTAITLGRSAKLDLQGFTVTGGLFGVGCFEVCSDGSGACNDDGARCEIVNGTITGALASGITGDVVTVRNVTATNNGEAGVQGYRKARAFDSTLTNNGDDGIHAWSVQVYDSTVTNNGRYGVAGGKYVGNGRHTHGIKVRDSIVTGNGTSGECSVQQPCADLASGTKPKVVRVTCDTSYSPFSVAGCGRHWCVCAIN
jgi:hypothetical protein